MGKLAIWAQLEAKPGKEKEVEEFLKSAQPLAETSRNCKYLPSPIEACGPRASYAAVYARQRGPCELLKVSADGCAWGSSLR